jgi:hypothetical protein
VLEFIEFIKNNEIKSSYFNEKAKIETLKFDYVSEKELYDEENISQLA